MQEISPTFLETQKDYLWYVFSILNASLIFHDQNIELDSSVLINKINLQRLSLWDNFPPWKSILLQFVIIR